jgi:hypothetical protein
MLYQYRRDYKPNIEQWLELFVGKFDMDVDVIDASPQMSRFHEMHFRQLSEVILSHQSVDLADWPLQQRFTIAMMLEHRTPLDFQRITGLPMSNQLAQLSDAQMGTALHWAAKQWCEEVPIEFVCKYSYSLERLGQFEQFIVALLENNALLHSIDKHGRTPLTMMLDFTFPQETYGLWDTYSIHQSCAVPAALWGRLLRDIGISLPEYVARENALLSARGLEQDIHLRPTWEMDVRLRRFVLSEQQTLRLEAVSVSKIDIWEFRPGPGLFARARQDCSTILWPPGADDGDPTCWQKVGSRELRSRPFRWSMSRELDVRETDDSSIPRVLFRQTRDDHSALALLLRRDRQRRTQGNTRGIRRSSSMPPIGTAQMHHKKQCEVCLYESEFDLPVTGDVAPRLHKCLFDSRWGFCVPDDDFEHSWRACMKGCQGRTDYSSLFQEFLTHTASQPKRMASELERIGRIVASD